MPTTANASRAEHQQHHIVALCIFTMALAIGCQRSDPETSGVASTPGTELSPRNPAVLVVVHSWTGRTAAVGAEIAAMLGGRFIRFGDGPSGEEPNQGRTLRQVIAELGNLQGVHDLYLGFPVWNEQPSAPILALVSQLHLGGVRVIPFYTFLHYIRPDSLQALHDALVGRGAQAEPEIPFLLRLNATTEEAVAEARQAVLTRPELWAGPADAPQGCHDGRCAIPAGRVWVGDTGADAPPGAPPPRLYSVDNFSIDEGEVTVAAYARCVAAGACGRADVANSFCGELIKQGGDGVPQPCVSFSQADAYCKWDGGRLPTESEWLRAARGQTPAIYPWGMSIIEASGPLRGNFGEKASTAYPGFAVVQPARVWPSDGYRGLAPPCSFPAGRSPFGVCDLMGNLAEWAVSLDVPPSDLALGASWLDGESTALRLGLRFVAPQSQSRRDGSYMVGFRCVR